MLRQENGNFPNQLDIFDVQVRLSDHTKGIGVALASIAWGATILEKHFTLRRADGGVDSTFSMEPEEMAQLFVESERAWQAWVKVQYGLLAPERGSLVFRRSLYAVKDMKAADIFTPDNLIEGGAFWFGFAS